MSWWCGSRRRQTHFILSAPRDRLDRLVGKLALGLPLARDDGGNVVARAQRWLVDEAGALNESPRKKRLIRRHSYRHPADHPNCPCTSARDAEPEHGAGNRARHQ